MKQAIKRTVIWLYCCGLMPMGLTQRVIDTLKLNEA